MRSETGRSQTTSVLPSGPVGPPRVMRSPAAAPPAAQKQGAQAQLAQSQPGGPASPADGAGACQRRARRTAPPTVTFRAMNRLGVGVVGTRRPGIGDGAEQASSIEEIH